MRSRLTALPVARSLVAGVGILLLFPEPSVAQNSETLANQVNRLQRDVQVLSRQVYQNSAPNLSGETISTGQNIPKPAGNAYIVRVEDRLSQLEEETRSNTGYVENITNTLSKISARLDTLSNDINFRLQTIENRLNVLNRNSQLMGQGLTGPGESGAVVPPKLAAAPRPPGVKSEVATGGSALTRQPGSLGTISQTDLNAVRNPGSPAPAGKAPQPADSQQETASVPSLLPKGSVQDQYKYAFGLVRTTEYEKASKVLGEFIETYPDEPLTSNARYWLGRTHLVQKKYRQAAEVFLASYQSNPKGPKAADNLLNLGMSLAGLNKNKEACATYMKLQQDFPQVSPVIQKRLAQQKTRTGCG